MTLEELRTVKFRYVSGVRSDTGATRLYQSEDGNLYRILRTPRRNGQWGTGVVSYEIKGQEKEYKTVDELLQALNEVES